MNIILIKNEVNNNFPDFNSFPDFNNFFEDFIKLKIEIENF